ncbi:GIY-YIG nuclease family protein [Glutamicibacter ardleyensis]|uniref:GIY-YIG nuclease family protein n=1 Tax=Glutamicibacter ardleyensis TaxID=225894 RepID=UPI003FD43D6D
MPPTAEHQLGLTVEQLQEKVHGLRVEEQALRERLAKLNAEADSKEHEQYLAAVKFRDDYPTAADGATAVAEAIKELRVEAKQMVKSGLALQIHGDIAKFFDTNAGVSNAMSKHIGKSYSDLILGYFHIECEAAVRQLRTSSNFEASLNRLGRAYQASANVTQAIGIAISDEYFELRMNELQLVYNHLAAKARERAEAKDERDRLREEQAAQQEFEKEISSLEKELEHYENMLQQMRSRDDGEAVERYAALIDEVRERIASIEERAANSRIGYVYVISNVGSFGENVVKIGLTRRLEPMNRVRELSNASVPFKYDVHAMVFSMDAVGLETAMHRRFDAERINTVNRRREFFRVTPRQVLNELIERNADVVEWVEDPAAEEFRLSKAPISE